MFRYKYDFAVVNRGFWEDDSNKVIGEALTDLAEKASEHYRTCVITQSKGQLVGRLRKAGRCGNVRLYSCKSLTSSVNSFLTRAMDATLFAFFVFFSLLRSRPRCIYIATDPPIVVPFVVCLYSLLFRSKYFYHLQDIHPEASNLVVQIPSFGYKIMKMLDTITISKSEKVITLSEDMASYLRNERGFDGELVFLENPSGYVPVSEREKDSDFVFCGNIGRLQRIPLLLQAIKIHRESGGRGTFTFIGGGVHAELLSQSAKAIEGLSYLGPMSPDKASEVIARHHWALLPIEDSVTPFAFPSKSSTYLLSGCRILAVCGADTSVGKWVSNNEYGVVCEPDASMLSSLFTQISEGSKDSNGCSVDGEVSEKYSYHRFSRKMIEIILT